MEIVGKIAERLKSAEKVCIFTHISPDGDALGSSFAMKRILESIGKQADLYLEKEIPGKFSFIEAEYLTTAPAEQYDTAICLDCGEAKRLGTYADYFSAHKNRIALDHHQQTPSFADLNWTDSESAATSELVFVLMKELAVKPDYYTLTCLFTAISTDTGNFKFSNVRPHTFHMAGELMELGLHIREITKILYDTMKLSKLKFMGMLADQIKLHLNGSFAVLETPESMFTEYGLEHADIEELPSIPLNIEGVLVSLVVKDDEGARKKYSLRGKEAVDLSAVARQLNGGGHKNAAGFTSELPVDEVVKIIIAQIEEPLRAIQNHSNEQLVAGSK